MDQLMIHRYIYVLHEKAKDFNNQLHLISNFTFYF